MRQPVKLPGMSGVKGDQIAVNVEHLLKLPDPIEALAHAREALLKAVIRRQKSPLVLGGSPLGMHVVASCRHASGHYVGRRRGDEESRWLR